MRPFFYIICILLSILLFNACDAQPHDQQVKWVYDGDTLLLKDGRKIRIIGINTPEVAHHKKKGERYGREATEQLRALLKQSNNRVRLELGKEKLDRYKRHLAHVFLPDGRDISLWMLKNGWATTMIFPPNTHYIEDYQQAEHTAQKKKLNIWRQKNHQIITSSQLKKSYTGYVRLKARIKKIKLRKKSVILQLDKKILIKLGKRYIKYFDTYDPKKLLHKNIIISGILRKHRGKRTITLRHPAQLDILN